MPRRRREQLQCTQCNWAGRTTHGQVRLAIFGLTTSTVVLLVALELLGLTQLGDLAWTSALTIMLLSIGLRLLIRGDRCRECNAPAVPARGRQS
jgi:hypothetical protein